MLIRCEVHSSIIVRL